MAALSSTYGIGLDMELQATSYSAASAAHIVGSNFIYLEDERLTASNVIGGQSDDIQEPRQRAAKPREAAMSSEDPGAGEQAFSCIESRCGDENDVENFGEDTAHCVNFRETTWTNNVFVPLAADDFQGIIPVHTGSTADNFSCTDNHQRDGVILSQHSIHRNPQQS
ncbi:hypothetical protein ACG7TL_008420 [Trametes sanguinea]